MLPRITRYLFLLTLMLVISISVNAAEISGKVMEVTDGNTFSLKSLSHTIKIRLLAVAPPEKGQPYADVARKHLADLILGKYVVVRYTGIGSQGFLVSRVLLEQGDINAQMLRDGAAWYYQPDADDLSESDRQLYPACEAAARSERRGLWQDQAPVSPWAYRKGLLPPPVVSAPTPTPPPAQAYRRLSKRSALNSEDMMGGALAPGTLAGKPDIKQISPGAKPGAWVKFQSTDRHFSILAPSDGMEISYPVLDIDGKLTQIHYLIGKKDGSFYALIWAKGPNREATATTTADEMVKSLVGGMNHAIEKSGVGYIVSVGQGRNVGLTGYLGKQYDLSFGYASGIVRVLSKQIGDEREVFTLLVLDPGEPSGPQFFNSFKINPTSVASR